MLKKYIHKFWNVLKLSLDDRIMNTFSLFFIFMFCVSLLSMFYIETVLLF